MRDVYAATHWAMQGQPPAYHTPDEDVYLPGRNIVLLGKAGVYCAAAKLDRLVLGTLDHNPFPDATPAFRARDGRARCRSASRTICGSTRRTAASSKAEVIARGIALGVPFELTLSCMSPGIGNRESGAGSRIPNPESHVTAACAASAASATMRFSSWASPIPRCMRISGMFVRKTSPA